MDPISITVSAASLATFAAKLVKGLASCIEQVKSSASALNAFSAELSALEKTLEEIDVTLRRSDLHHALRRVLSPQDAQGQLATMDAMLKACDKAFRDLEALLAGIQAGRLAHGMLRTPAMAWKLNSKSPELGRIQQLVKSYASAMQTRLQIMNL
jgi:Fungal N-terminal domain of STAND proteins